MLRKHSQFFVQVLFVFDLLLLCACWLLAYLIRFRLSWVLARFPLVEDHTPPLRKYVPLLWGIVLVWGIVFKVFRIYKPRRTQPFLIELADIFKAFTFAFMAMVVVNFFLMRESFSRVWWGIFYLLGFTLLGLCHYAFRRTLRALRRRGYNLRHVLVVGAGRTALEVARSFQGHREMGFRVVGLLGPERDRVGTRIEGFPVIGTYEEVAEVVRERDLDEVILALPTSDQHRFTAILDSLGEELADIHIVPDFLHVGSMGVSAGMFDGIPFITFRTSPLAGWGRVLKRAFDVVTALAALILFSAPMLLIAFLVKATSRGPIFYRQERMGLDGRRFTMLKFRSMRVGAEQETGPVWARKGDERCTSIGRFLRRTSLDELPQLFNVLRGEMSMVGPRPERPVFVEKFRRAVPKYMLRHKIKAGITGWAQVNGWRGDTSIEERIRHDIHYIEHWSLWFDVRILLMTLWRGFLSRNAY